MKERTELVVWFGFTLATFALSAFVYCLPLGAFLAVIVYVVKALM
jgi:hypothetical protein